MHKGRYKIFWGRGWGLSNSFVTLVNDQSMMMAIHDDAEQGCRFVSAVGGGMIGANIFSAMIKATKR